MPRKKNIYSISYNKKSKEQIFAQKHIEKNMLESAILLTDDEKRLDADRNYRNDRSNFCEENGKYLALFLLFLTTVGAAAGGYALYKNHINSPLPDKDTKPDESESKKCFIENGNHAKNSTRLIRETNQDQICDENVKNSIRLAIKMGYEGVPINAVLCSDDERVSNGYKYGKSVKEFYEKYPAILGLYKKDNSHVKDFIDMLINDACMLYATESEMKQIIDFAESGLIESNNKNEFLKQTLEINQAAGRCASLSEITQYSSGIYRSSDEAKKYAPNGDHLVLNYDKNGNARCAKTGNFKAITVSGNQNQPARKALEIGKYNYLPDTTSGDIYNFPKSTKFITAEISRPIRTRPAYVKSPDILCEAEICPDGIIKHLPVKSSSSCNPKPEQRRQCNPVKLDNIFHDMKKCESQIAHSGDNCTRSQSRR